MAILLSCTCGRKLQVKDQFAGQEGQCPACGRTLQIPAAAAPEAEEVPGLRAVLVEEQGPPEAAPPDKPTEPLRNHGGEPLPADADFFVPPPAEIGPLMSAYTTLRRGVRPWSVGARFVGAGLAALAGLVVGGVIVSVFTVRSDFWQVAWPLGGGIAGLSILLLASRFHHTCTYVGREGVARFVCTGSRENLTVREVFRFRDATELRTSQTMHYVNGAYQNTRYSFTWTDVGGRCRYVINGAHTSKPGTPPSKDFYHFARAAEFAWTVCLSEQVFRQVELSGSVLFNLQGGKWVRLGPRTVTFGLGASPEECPADDIAGVKVEKGVVVFRRKDAREGFFSSQGVHKFPFDQLANAQLFFHLLDRLVGVPVG